MNNSNSINFFGWIRNGVKQSVLLGVSDAIETIGTPEDPSGLHPNVVALLRGQQAEPASSANAARLPGQPNSRNKRLGKSLRDIEPTPGS